MRGRWRGLAGAARLDSTVRRGRTASSASGPSRAGRAGPINLENMRSPPRVSDAPAVAPPLPPPPHLISLHPGQLDADASLQGRWTPTPSRRAFRPEQVLDLRIAQPSSQLWLQAAADAHGGARRLLTTAMALHQLIGSERGSPIEAKR